MDHCVMFLILVYLAESGPAKSGEIAEGLKSLRISREYASLVLTRCYRRRFVSRCPYKRGRERGYVYQLSDKGAEWLVYKASHKKDTDLHDREPVIEVDEKSIHPPSLVPLNPIQNQQRKRDFIPIEPLLAEYATQIAGKYYSMKQKFDLAVHTLVKVSRERDFACWLYLMEHEEKLKLLEKTKHEKTAGSHECFHRGRHQKIKFEPSVKYQHEKVDRLYEAPLKGRHQGIRFGLKLGIPIGEFRQLLRIQNTLAEFLLKKMSGSFQSTIPDSHSKTEQASSRGKLVSSLLQVRLSRKRKDENLVDDNVYPYCNSWWNSLPSG